MTFETTIAIKIGKTNSYVSINGTTVANADGVRATPSICNNAGDVGLAAQSKWVRQPENVFERSDKKFWHTLLRSVFGFFEAVFWLEVSQNVGPKFKKR